VGGVQYQKVKVDFGGDGASAPVTAATGLPVDATGQGDVPVTLDSEVVAVDATGQGDVPITLDGEEITANLGATDNAVLDAIQAAVEGTLTADVTGQGDVPVTLDSEVVAVDATGQGDVPITLDGETVELAASTASIGKLAANSGVDIGDVDVTSISAGENHLGQVGMEDDCITVTLTLDNGNAYADGDVLSATQEIAGAVRNNGETCILQSVHVTDIDDQGMAFDIIFFNANTSLGTENAAPDIDDTEVLTTIGKVSVTAADYIDLGANQIATVYGIGLPLEAGAATTSLYFATITRDAPTYTTNGLAIKFGFLRN
jgi:hypothetical protein